MLMAAANLPSQQATLSQVNATICLSLLSFPLQILDRDESATAAHKSFTYSVTQIQRKRLHRSPQPRYATL